MGSREKWHGKRENEVMDLYSLDEFLVWKTGNIEKGYLMQCFIL